MHQKLLMIVVGSMASLGILGTLSGAQPSMSSRPSAQPWPKPPANFSAALTDAPGTRPGDTAIVFPFYVGRLSRMPVGWLVNNKRNDDIFIGPAKGRVLVPKNADLSLKLDYVLTEHPELLVVPPSRIVQIVGDGIAFEDGICAPISKIPSVTRVELGSSEITDAGVVKLCAMKQLRAVTLDRTMIDGTCLHALAQLPLTYLDISQNKIKPSVFKDFALFKQVRRARFIGDDLTDDALKYIGQMDSLFDVQLRSNTRLTNEGLKHLSNLKHLHWVNLRDTKIGLDGVEWLITHLNLSQLVVDEKILDNGRGERLKSKYKTVLNSYSGRNMNEMKTLYAPLK